MFAFAKMLGPKPISLMFTLIVPIAFAQVAGAGSEKLVAGQTRLGVTRHQVQTLMPGRLTGPATVAVTPAGTVITAVVVLQENREQIWLQKGSLKRPGLSDPKMVSPGSRAWHPRLAAAPNGAVWLTWCGESKRTAGDAHARAVFLRKVYPGKPGPVVPVSNASGRACDPDLAIGGNKQVHVVWEQSSKADPGQVKVYGRAFAANGRPLGKAQAISAGPFDRRPSVTVSGQTVLVAWDRLVSDVSDAAGDPDYDVFLRRRLDSDWLETIRIDGREGIQAAPRLLPAPDGGVIVAYHSSHRHGLVKWWELRKVAGDKIFALASEDAQAAQEPAGEQQGAEFPALAVSPKGRVVIFSRPSQGAYLQRVDDAGVSPVLDLTRRGWGARGQEASMVWAADGTVLLARRARHHAVLERFSFSDARVRAPAWVLARAGSKPAEKRRRIRLAGDAKAETGEQVLFGDLHMHSAATDGTGPNDEIYARAWASGLDFAVLTDHGGIIGTRLFPSAYEENLWISDAFNRRDGFSTLYSFEWTSPSYPKGAGHRNVYYLKRPKRLHGFRQGFSSTEKLFGALAGVEALAIPHHTSWTGTDWNAADERIQCLFEIVSVHGAGEYAGNLPIASRGNMAGMFAVDGLDRGLKFGFVGGSDAHGLAWHHGIGRRRNPWSHGLTGVWAAENRRDLLFQAMRSRATFASSGAAMSVKMTAAGIGMGQEGQTKGPVSITAKVEGTLEIKSMVLVRDGKELHRISPASLGAEMNWTDREAAPGRHYYYVRAVQGAGEQTDMVWSSPVFLELTP